MSERGVSAVASRLAESDPAGLVYGAIVTAAVLATAGGHLGSTHEVLAACVFVLAIYWMAHVYVVALAMQFRGETATIARRALTAAREERGVPAGGIPAIVVFIVSSAFVSTSRASEFALYFTVVLLFTVGYLGARHAGLSIRSAATEALLASMFGVLMILAKSLLH